MANLLPAVTSRRHGNSGFAVDYRENSTRNLCVRVFFLVCCFNIPYFWRFLKQIITHSKTKHRTICSRSSHCLCSCQHGDALLHIKKHGDVLQRSRDWRLLKTLGVRNTWFNTRFLAAMAHGSISKSSFFVRRYAATHPSVDTAVVLPPSHLLQLMVTSSGWILFFSIPFLGCPPRPRNSPGGSILKLPMRSLWWSSRQ